MSSNIKMGLWDMQVVGGDVTSPDNVFTWSQDYRHMLGFEDENDFPNVLSSWADRLHPDHKEKTLKAFEKAILDESGESIYDVEYLLQRKDGEYHWYRATGQVDRDADGKALRIVGSNFDIGDERAASGNSEFHDHGAF